jgi:hypothetical protein
VPTKAGAAIAKAAATALPAVKPLMSLPMLILRLCARSKHNNLRVALNALTIG